jgi:hypothetical protein
MAPTLHFPFEKFKQKPVSIGKILRSFPFRKKNCVYHVAQALPNILKQKNKLFHCGQPPNSTV